MGAEVLGSLLSDITSIVCGCVITPRLVMGLADADHENDILWIVRTQAQSLIEMFERPFGLTSQCKGISEKSMRSREVGIQFECMLKSVFGCIGLFAHCGKLAEGQMRPWVAAIQFGGSGCKLSGLLYVCSQCRPTHETRH